MAPREKTKKTKRKPKSQKLISSTSSNNSSIARSDNENDQSVANLNQDAAEAATTIVTEKLASLTIKDTPPTTHITSSPLPNGAATQQLPDPHHISAISLKDYNNMNLSNPFEAIIESIIKHQQDTIDKLAQQITDVQYQQIKKQSDNIYKIQETMRKQDDKIQQMEHYHAETKHRTTQLQIDLDEINQQQQELLQDNQTHQQKHNQLQQKIQSQQDSHKDEIRKLTEQHAKQLEDIQKHHESALLQQQQQHQQNHSKQLEDIQKHHESALLQQQQQHQQNHSKQLEDIQNNQESTLLQQQQQHQQYQFQTQQQQYLQQQYYQQHINLQQTRIPQHTQQQSHANQQQQARVTQQQQQSSQLSDPNGYSNAVRNEPPAQQQMGPPAQQQMRPPAQQQMGPQAQQQMRPPAQQQMGPLDTATLNQQHHVQPTQQIQQQQQQQQNQQHQQQIQRNQQAQPSKNQQSTRGSGPMKSRIFTDSTCSRFKHRDIAACIDERQETIAINKYPNAEATEMLHYAKYFLENDRPDNIIIVSGLNDLLHHKERARADAHLISENILQIGRESKRRGVWRVCISGLVKPKYENCRQKVEEINTLLWEKCRKEGFIYIDQSNIDVADMGDMIHVGQHGLHKLKDNVLNQLHTYKTPPPSNHYH